MFAKWVLVILVVLLFLPASAWAGPHVLSWDQVTVATTYGIDQSLDNGVTWTAVTLAAAPACALNRCSATVTAPATGLALYRIWAANNVGRTTRFNAGLWVCESCAPPPAAANVGVQ